MIRAPPRAPLGDTPDGHPYLLIIAVADILVEAVETLHVPVVQVVRGQISAPSEPPFSRHLGEEPPPKKNTKSLKKTHLVT